MPDYMVIVKGEITSATFFNNFDKMLDYISVAEAALGYYCEAYERINGVYTLLYGDAVSDEEMEECADV